MVLTDDIPFEELPNGGKIIKDFEKKVWLNIRGYRHREDGPAVEWHNGKKWWYLYGIYYTEGQWKEELIKLKLKRINNL